MSALYLKLGYFQKYGESQFYSFVEHLLFIFYGLCSLFSCRWMIKRKGDPQAFTLADNIQVIFYSGVLNALLTTAVFLTFRLVAFSILGYSNWIPPVIGILLNMTTSFLLVHLIISGLLLAYNNMRLHHKALTQQLNAEKALVSLQLKNLQAQFTPHFLFNNLNILAGLIPMDPVKAEQYVRLLAALYRFVIQHNDQRMISLEKELKFVEQYSELMNIRFANAYQINVVREITPDVDVFVVPGAIQSCIENAIKHNVGSQTCPLFINLVIEANKITISNKIKAKKQQASNTQQGLIYLTDLYNNLSDKPVVVSNDGEQFVVSIPLIFENAGLFDKSPTMSN